MSFLQKYACMYGDIEFTPDEEEELGRFAAKLMKLAMTDDENGMVDLYADEFGDIDADSFGKINNYLDWLEYAEKNAAGGGPYSGGAGKLMGNIGKVIGPLSLALAAAPLIGHGLKALTKSTDLKRSLRRIFQMHPDLKQDPNVQHYFQAIADFAPDIAKNPLVAGNVIMQMHRVGPGFVTPQLIRELIGIQGQAGAGKFGTPGSSAAEMSKPTMDLAKFLTGKGK